MQLDQLLLVTNVSFDASAPFTVEYDWSRCMSGDGGCSSLSVPDAGYAIQPTDLNQWLQARVTVTNDAGQSAMATALRGPVRTRPALAWLSGFEHGVENGPGALYQSASMAQIIPGAARTGRFGLRTEGAAQLRIPLTANQLAFRFAVRVPQSLSAGAQIAAIEGTPGCAINIQSSGGPINISLTVGTSMGAPPPNQLIPVQWHVVTCQVSASNTTCRLDDGINFTAGAAPMNLTALRLGGIGAGTPRIEWDDIVVSNNPSSFPLHDGTIVGLGLSAEAMHASAGSFTWTGLDGGTGTLTPGGGGATWALLNDWPPTAGSITQATPGTAFAEYDLEDLTGVRAPTAIRALFAHQSDIPTGMGNFAVQLTCATPSVYDGGARASQGIGYYGRTYDEAIGGAAWSRGSFDTCRLRFGLSSNVSSGPRLEAVLIEAELPQ
jgi:hypothetical protein